MSGDFLSKPLSLAITPAFEESKSGQTSSDTSGFSAFGAPVSPYLNYDPRFLQQAQPEFIFPVGATMQRGRFELAFSQIGASVIAGASIGGMAGYYNGMKTTKALQQTGKLWRTQMLNHVMKQGSGTANTLGSLALMYSVFGVLLQNVRGKEDEINTILAGTATGFLYKSTVGLRKCALGGAVGLGLSGLYCLVQIMRQNSNYEYV